MLLGNSCAWSSSTQDGGIHEEIIGVEVQLKPAEEEGGGMMDSPTGKRLERLEKQMGAVLARLAAVEKVLQEMNILLKKQGIERGKNYDAP
jgi:hypothetical protein